MGLVDEGRTLLFSMIEQCFAKKIKKKKREEKKKELKRLDFLLKSVINLLS